MFAINLFSSLDKKRKLFTLPEGKAISEYLKDENINFEHCIILVGGHKVDENYRPNENDIIFVRELPSASVTTVALIITAVVSVVAGVAAGVSLYKAKQAQAEAEKAMKNANSASAGSIEALPFLKGATNQAASGRSFPYFIGRHYFTPYRLQPKYYETLGSNGENEYCNLVLEAGFNDLVIETISLGNNKIASFDKTTPESEIKGFDKGTYYNEENIIEIQQKDAFTTEQFNKKIVSNFLNQEIAHDYGTSLEDVVPVVTQLEENAKSMDICIQFDGLRKLVNNNWKEQTVTIKAYWSNLESPDTSDLTQWNELTNNQNTTFEQYIWDGTYTNATNRYRVSAEDIPTLSYVSTTLLANNVDKWTFVSGDSSAALPTTANADRICNIDYQGYYVYFDYQYKHERNYSEHIYSNTFTYNTLKQMRFVLHKDFTYDETFGKNISIMLVRTTPKADGSSNETCSLYYVNTEVFDYQKSKGTNSLITALPLEDDAREKCCRIGIRMKADDNNESLSDSVNIVACGVARTWNSTTESWSEEKTPTRNGAAWILEVLTSDVHKWSKYDDAEIVLDSLGQLYETCKKKEYYVDGVITEDKTKQSILDDLCSACHCSLIWNNQGKLEVIEDKAEENAIALLNTQDISDFTVTKSFTRKPDGLKVTFTNNESWTKETFYCMKDGTMNHGATSVITEIAPNFVTDFNHAWSIARRTLAESYLQPKTLTVNVGKEGAYYPLHSCVLVQLPHLKIGLTSSVITALIYEDDEIVGIKIADQVTFEAGKSYGVIIQQMDDYGKHLIDAVVTGTGTTDTLYLDGSEWDNIPTAQNILSFGELDDDGTVSKVSQKFKICDVAPTDNGYALTLKEYNSAIYDETGAIPEYVSSVTPHQNERVVITPTMEDVRQQNDIVVASVASLFNTNTVTLYKESSEILTDDKPTSDLIHNFQEDSNVWTNADTGFPKLSNGWSWEYPTEHTNTVYMIQGTAQSQAMTAKIVPSSWSDCIASGQNGVNGTNTYTITLYKRSNDAPSQKPSTLTYNFSTGDLSGTKNGWATSIPTVTDEGLPVWEIHATAFSTGTTDTINPSEWSNAVQITADGITIEDVKEIVQEELQNVVETPNVSYDYSQFNFAVNNKGFTTVAQSISSTIHVLQTNEELNFRFDTDAIREALPSGMTFTIDYHTITFRVNAGVKIANGEFKIPIIYKVFKYNNVLGWEIDGVEYQLAPTEDADAVPLGYSSYYDDESTYNVGFSYSAIKGGSNLGGVSSLPTGTVIIGDYFTWKGTNGTYKKGTQYTWNGVAWVEDHDTEHLAGGLADVLDVLNTELAANNSDAVELLDKLTANEIYAGKVVTNLLEADTVVSQKFQSDYAEIQTAVINELATEKLTIKSLEDYTTTEDLDEELAEKADNQDVTDVVTALSNPTGQTIIEGGKINTDKIDVDEITAGLASIDYLKGGDAEFKGKVTATSGSFLGSVSANSLNIEGVKASYYSNHYSIGKSYNVENEVFYVKNELPSRTNGTNFFRACGWEIPCSGSIRIQFDNFMVKFSQNGLFNMAVYNSDASGNTKTKIATIKSDFGASSGTYIEMGSLNITTEVEAGSIISIVMTFITTTEISSPTYYNVFNVATLGNPDISVSQKNYIARRLFTPNIRDVFNIASYMGCTGSYGHEIERTQ